MPTRIASRNAADPLAHGGHRFEFGQILLN